MTFQKLDNCLACRSKNLKEYLNLGDQPPANALQVKSTDKVDIYPLKVNFCLDCSHSQLSIAVDPDELFKDYKYVSGTTNTLKKHFKELAELSSFHYRDPNNKSVLDIGCNDGSLLEEFRKLDFEIMGVDPAENLREITKQKGIPVLVDYWSWDFVGWFSRNYLGKKFGVVTALNCLAHNSDPYEFLLSCKQVLSEKGTIVVEFPYFGSTLKLNDLGQIYHEHCSYFTMKSFAKLLRRTGLKIKELSFMQQIHGGTTRFILEKGHQTEINFENEVRMKLDNLETYEKFNNNIHYNWRKLAIKIHDLNFDNKKGYVKKVNIVAYGASAKLSTLLNMKVYNQEAQHLPIQIPIDYAVDDNPLKHGYYIPGTSVQIKPTEELKKEKNLVILCGAHNFKEEIKTRLANMGVHGKMLNYTPEVTIEDF